MDVILLLNKLINHIKMLKKYIHVNITNLFAWAHVSPLHLSGRNEHLIISQNLLRKKVK